MPLVRRYSTRFPSVRLKKSSFSYRHTVDSDSRIAYDSQFHSKHTSVSTSFSRSQNTFWNGCTTNA